MFDFCELKLGGSVKIGLPPFFFVSISLIFSVFFLYLCVSSGMEVKAEVPHQGSG